MEKDQVKSPRSEGDKSVHQQCIEVARLDEPSIEWFIAREPRVRKLIGVCEDNAPPGGVIDAAWDELVSWEIDGSEDHRKSKPKETEATERASKSEPVKARIDMIIAAAAALARASHGDYPDEEADVMRFQAVKAREQADALLAEVRRLREERDLFRTASEAAELRIVELKAKLARVEALVQHGTVSWETVFDALQPRDEPQPEREPKLPYNGY